VAKVGAWSVLQTPDDLARCGLRPAKREFRSSAVCTRTPPFRHHRSHEACRPEQRSVSKGSSGTPRAPGGNHDDDSHACAQRLRRNQPRGPAMLAASQLMC
jgi:hypothetical protein